MQPLADLTESRDLVSMQSYQTLETTKQSLC